MPIVTCCCKAGDPYHVVFIQIRMSDGNEFDPFQQGLRLVLCFSENALIKSQPGQFPVQV